MILEENIGPVSVQVKPALYSEYQQEDSDSDAPLLTAELTNTADLERPDFDGDLAQVGRMLGLPESAIRDVFFAGVGLGFCFVQIDSGAEVDQAVLDKGVWSEVLKDQWASAVFIFSGELKDGRSLYARMFAPAFGIEEDPATGSAAAALVGVAASTSDMSDGEFALLIHQGVAMGRNSEMMAKAKMEEGKLRSVSVGGATAMTAKGEIRIDPKWCCD